MKTDLPSVVLTKEERRYLKQLKRKQKISDEAIRKICVFGFVEEVNPVFQSGRMIQCDYVISDDGLRYLQHVKDVSADRRWTRCLSVAAILISLAALLLEFQSRGLFPFF